MKITCTLAYQVEFPRVAGFHKWAVDGSDAVIACKK